MATRIAYPHYWQIYRHVGDKWYHRPAEKSSQPLPERIEAMFGLTPSNVVTSLFKVNGGWQGFYIANLRERKYFYCGLDWEDVVNTFEALGVSNRHIRLIDNNEK